MVDGDGVRGVVKSVGFKVLVVLASGNVSLQIGEGSSTGLLGKLFD